MSRSAPSQNAWNRIFPSRPAGSSSLKFALYAADTGDQLPVLYHGQVSKLDGVPHFAMLDHDGRSAVDISLPRLRPDKAIAYLFDWLKKHAASLHIVAAGHRVVHGRSRFDRPVRIDPQVYEQLQALVPLAPPAHAPQPGCHRFSAPGTP